MVAVGLFADAGAGRADEGLFRTSIPAGFEDLSAPQTSLIDVYFLDQHVDVAVATFEPGSFVFADPGAVVAKLPPLRNPGAVTLALAGDLEPHAGRVCGARKRPGCGALAPDVAGVIFDAARFRVDLFVHPSLLEPQLTQPARFLPVPEAGFSALQTIYMAAAGSTAGENDFTLRQDSMVAYDNGRVVGATSLSSADGARLDVLAGEADREAWRYVGGLYRTALSALLGDRRLIGLGAVTSTDTRLDREQIRGNELTLFLPSRARVEILREGRLLSAQSYPAGNQVLDTAALPEGAYEVTLRITEPGGAVREETRFFAKTSAVPPRGAPRYVLEAGLLGTEGTSLGDFSEQPAVHGGTTHRLTRSIALGADVIVSPSDQLLELSAFYLTSLSTLSFSALGGVDGTAGLGLNAYGLLERFSYSISGRRRWAGDGAVLADSTGADGSTGLDLSLNYALSSGPRLGLRASWHRRDGADGHYAFGPTLFWPLPPQGTSRLDLIAEAVRTEEETRATVRLRVQFDGPGYTTTSESGYAAAFGDTGSSRSGMLNRTGIFWNDGDRLPGDLRAGGEVIREPGVNALRAEADYAGRRGRVRGDVEQRLGGDAATSYGANAMVNILGNADRLAWGGREASRSGVVIAVDGQADASFEILVDGRPRGTVEVGQEVPLLLPEYNLYEIRLQPIDAPSIRFDATARRVSLYRGTIKTLRWQVDPVVVGFGRLLDQAGRPIRDALLEGGLEPSLTDDQGYFQIEVAGSTTLQAADPGALPCTAFVAVAPGGAELVDLGDVRCR